jgi:hypothetical protein
MIELAEPTLPGKPSRQKSPPPGRLVRVPGSSQGIELASVASKGCASPHHASIGKCADMA